MLATFAKPTDNFTINSKRFKDLDFYLHNIRHIEYER